MKPIMKFYREVLNYIRAENEIDGQVAKIVLLAEKASPSWEATAESLAFLEKCCNHGSAEVPDDEVWSSTRNDFVKAAFRDLSPISATDLFGEIANEIGTTFQSGDDMLIWARTIKERSDGSGVMVLHVTDMKRFRDLIEDHGFADQVSACHSLEKGVLVGS